MIAFLRKGFTILVLTAICFGISSGQNFYTENPTTGKPGRVAREEIFNPTDSTLSLDLPYYFNRNVVQLMAASWDDSTDYTNWTNKRWDDNAAGVHSDNSTQYLTDAQSITLTGSAATDGIHLDFTNIDLTHFTDGDTSVAADYICWAIYITTQDIADMPDVNGLILSFRCDARTTITNFFYKIMDDDDLSNGWNYFKVTKAAFAGIGAASSDTAWALVKGVDLYINGTPDAEVVVSIDNLQMVRDDPDAAEPNPFQSETINGTWTADWTQEGNGNVAIVEESNQISAASLDGRSSYFLCVNSFRDYSASGVVIAGTYSNNESAFLWDVMAGNYYATLYNGTFYLMDSTASSVTTSFVFATDDKLLWKYDRKGSSHTASVSSDGITWTSLTTFTWSTAKAPAIRIETDQRILSLGFSAVEYAAEAGVAQRLLGWHFNILGDSLQTTHGDSVYNMLINSRRAK